MTDFLTFLLLSPFPPHYSCPQPSPLPTLDLTPHLWCCPCAPPYTCSWKLWSLWIFSIEDHVICQETVLLFPFQSGCLSFPFLHDFCVRIFSTGLLNRIAESGQPCVVPDLGANAFSISPLSMMLAVGFWYTAFIMLKYISSILNSLSVFIMKRCWILSNAFSVTI